MLSSQIAASRVLAVSTPSSSSPDRGVIHQILVDLGVSSGRAHTIEVYTLGPLRVVLVVAVAVALSWLVRRVARRMVDGLRLVSPLVKATARGKARAQTLAGVFSSIFRAIICVIAVLTILGLLHINLLPFVATATVVGAAVGFGAQSLVKDFLSGVLIVAEDQYGVGDSIVVGTGASSTTGTVEGVTLRVTRIRGVDGVTWYIPNGDIRTVGNNTDSDSEAIVDVIVPHGTDLVAAGADAEAAARRVAVDPSWEGVFVGVPYFAGVVDTDHDGATLRVIARTRPGQHFRAARELRLRVLERLRDQGIVWTHPAGEGAAAQRSR